ncbi:amylo-alpha-1,6-glucosidase [Vampirovibrio chlorellavorus]|uniref:amylo-alpha-1,6-glucosidase n=1 Tax=Vampirovibrio chlorellavorus TaxID=758823 RepID=UPI0026EE97E4|nr:glycogen debranching N-terminal domain-containing protein [Vampirovibrio chlorellavorus]
MKIKQPEDFLSRNRSIKHNHLYLVDDLQGNIPRGDMSGLGMYHLDTRFLSCFEIKLHGTDPIPLLSSTEMGYMSTIVFTNGPIETTTEDGTPVTLPPEIIQLKRETVLYGLQFERFWLVSYYSKPVYMELSLTFDADFRDMFDIRGIVEMPPLQKRPPIMDTSGQNPVLIFGCKDRSGRNLQTGIRFVDLAPEEAPARDLPTVIYRTLLKPRHPLNFNYEIQTIINDHLMNAGVIETSVQTMDEALMHLNFRARRNVQDTAVFVSDNEDFNEMMSRNQKDMQMLTTHSDEGSYVAAGIPWYVALFGRDSLITSRFAMLYNPTVARESLKILAKYQGKETNPHRDEEPGKILHEMRVGELARLGEIPHTPYYGSVDSTPLFIITLYEYFRWTNDRELLCKLWPNALAALNWIDDNLRKHPLGFSTYRSSCPRGILQQGWKDSYDSVMDEFGVIGQPPIALSEVQGYVYLAKTYMARLADYMENKELRQRLKQDCLEFRKRFNTHFWMDDLEYCALALNETGQPFRVITSNPGHCLETGLFYENHANQTVNRLMSADLFNGWGIRTLSSNTVAYNPMSYHNGSIWPHDNALIARGFARLNRPDLVERIFTGLFEAARHMYYRRLPELFCGFRKEDGKEGDPPVRYAVSCNPQAWASAAMYSIIQSMLNMRVDAPRKKLSIHSPRLPHYMSFLQINNLCVGKAMVDLEFRRNHQSVTVDVRNRKGELDITVQV